MTDDSSQRKPQKKILLVDDEQDITNVIKRGLEQTGKYIVDTFNHPRDALTNFRAGVYDLLIIDIKMPGMTGFQLYKELIKIDPRPKICFITAFEMYYDEFRKLFPSMDVKCFIRKPFNIADLTREVEAEFQSTAPRVRPR